MITNAGIIENALVTPDVTGAKAAMELFERLKQEILNKNDTIQILNKPYIKRSGWRKIALAFNIKTEILKIERESIDDILIIRVFSRATAPNGRFAEEVGVCDSSEFEQGKLKFSYHNLETKAVTRAINRAISDLVGGGEVSAEEMIRGEDKVVDQNNKQYENYIKVPAKKTTEHEFYPASRAQINYIKDLLRQHNRGLSSFTDKTLSNLSKSEAVNIIDQLLNLRNGGN